MYLAVGAGGLDYATVKVKLKAIPYNKLSSETGSTLVGTDLGQDTSVHYCKG